MTERLDVLKSCKLYINGSFPRSESGRTIELTDRRGRVIAHICRGSRKDLRDAVEVARATQSHWAQRSGYNRGQILYRMAEMMEGRREEFAEAIRATGASTPAAARREVDASVDRLVSFAGWADKYDQVLGCRNPVAGSYYNFTTPEATGVVGVIGPDEPALLGLVTLLVAPLCAGNALVALASHRHPLPAVLVGEVCATADVPPGIVNIITCVRTELIEPLAQHRNVDAIGAANLTKRQAGMLRRGTAENVKRICIEKITPAGWFDAEMCESPWRIEPFVEMKTIWHPSAM
jgi:acyl-CoA reductase-like NAD-dependent aldehyde dehydrogenase